MSQRFVKGRTTNHLTWAMVDATDFATRESAASAATTIKVYGKLRADDTVYFVSSGTGSLTNDIKHVGASALGLYTLGFAKADLSDASAAWYDQYIINLSCTGCAYQTLVVDGGIDASALSALQSRISDVQSYLVALSATISDAHSAAILGASNASDAYSAALLAQSLASDAHSAANVAASRALVNQSRISDVQSFLSDFQSDLISHIDTTGVALNASAMSDLRSAINAGPAATVTASDISDIASAVWAYSTRSVSLVASAMSDIRSAIAAGPAATVTASDISDIASAVYATLSSDLSDILSRATQINSRVALVQSNVSDVESQIDAGVELGASSLSDLRSAIAATELDASDLSDIASAVWAAKYTAHSAASSFGSLFSDVYSRVAVAQSAASDAASAAQQANSRVLVNQSRVSDIYSLLSDLHSDLGVVSGVVSDVYSLLSAGPEVGASSMSDIRSAITAAGFAAAGADPTAAPGVTASYGAKLDWLAAMSRNKLEQTSSEQTLYRDDGTTVTASAVCSDDGTTATRSEFT